MMNRLAAVVAMGVLFASAAFATPTEDPAEEALKALKHAESVAVSAAQWNTFSKQLTDALTSDHEGVQVAAMQLVIRYGEQVDVRSAVPEVMRVYREHDDDDVRRMAVVALGQMNSRRAVGFLRLSEEFEPNETVRRTIHAVVAQHEAAGTS